MKIAFCCLLLTVCSATFGQDYCKRIKKEVSDDKKSINYSSPFDPQEPASLHVTRNVNLDPDYPSDNFYLIFRITGTLESIYAKTDTGQVEKDEKKIVIEFDDKASITDENIQVSHDFTDDKLQAIRYVYFPLTEQNMKDFTTKKITKFSLAGFEQTVVSDTAVSVQHYVVCIRDAK